MSNSRLANVDLRDTDTIGLTIEKANLNEANLKGLMLSNALMTKSTFAGANLSDTQMSQLYLKGADFEGATLKNAKASNTNFSQVNFEDASLVQADIRDSNFKNTRFYQTLFSDTRINSNTDFGDTTAYEDPDIDLGENYEDTSRFEAAAWVYRRLQDLHEENAMSEQAREYHVRKEEAHRSNYWSKGQYFQWFVYTLNRYLTRHGESLKHVVTWSVGTILTCALAYPFAGGISTGNEVFRVGSGAALGGLFLRSLYFSTVTFTTLGYGDYHPVGPAAKALAGAESLAGALLVALFVFVLGRRVAR
nr:pentapeptide repeat-containing protein [Halorussus salinus]